MKTIYKYRLDPNSRGDIEVPMPEGAKIIHAGRQDGHLTLWAEVDTAKPTVIRYFLIFGTGWDMGDTVIQHVHTWQDGWAVWHLYEIMGVAK